MAIDTSTVWPVPLSDRASIAASLGLLGLTAAAAGRALSPREPLPEPRALAPEQLFSPEQISRGRAFRRPQAILGLLRAAVEVGVLSTAVIGLHGRSRLEHRGPAVDAVGAGAAGAGLALGTTLLGLPLSAASRRRAVRVGLATDSWADWGRDLIKSAALEAGLSGVLLTANSALASRLGDRWWRAGAAGALGVSVLAGLLAPVLTAPLFNTFEPLPDGPLRADVLDLARRAGVNVGQVFSVDASRRGPGVNAYVNGLGPTKRVVLYDTLISGYERDEIRFVVAHELGHVHHRDILRQLAFLTLCAAPATRAIQGLTLAWAGQLSGARAVPALSLATWSVGTPLLLAGAALSRAVERRTDQFGLELSGAPEALESFFCRIAIQNCADVTAPGPLRALLASHPPITERIGAARAYAALAIAGGRGTPEGS